MDDLSAELRSRLREQARVHWLEFAVIVASANLLLALVLSGQIVQGRQTTVITIMASGIVVASVLAVILAYYSIQVGTLVLFGPLRLGQVVSSFLIAGTQLALFYWPAQVLAVPAKQLEGLRHWLLFYAAFAFSAAVASWLAATSRRRQGLTPTFRNFEDGQLRDRRAACVAGGVACLCWALSFKYLLPSMILGVFWTMLASALGVAAQARVAGVLTEEVSG